MKKRNYYWLLVVILCGIIAFAQYTYGFKIDDLNESKQEIYQEEEPQKNVDFLKIHYLDVGQGDSTFIELPNQQTILIDGAEAKEKNKIIDYISSLNYTKIDYLIATHPHTDHIGGLPSIIEYFDISKIYMPKAVSTSKTYETLLNTIIAKNLKITTAKKDLIVLDEDNLQIKFLSPKEKDYQELNNYSAVLKITYLNHHFLFMGDAEELVEEEITDDVKSDMVKVGHHGSKTSSSLTFVNRVNPLYAIISVGDKNQYHHPSQEIIQRWQQVGAKVLQTNEYGTIIAQFDGNHLQINTEKQKESE